MSNVLDDVKTGAKAGAVKGAAAGALGVLGAKAANAAQSTSGDDLRKQARKGGKNAGKALDQAAKKVDLQGKTNAAGGLMQMVGKRASDAADGGVNINIDPNDIPRYLRGLTLLATGLGTLFAPGSPLDATRGGANVDLGNVNLDTGELSKQASKSIDTAADVTQQRIKEWVDLVKDSLSSLSDALTEGIETAESRMQQALDETEKTLTGATSQAASSAKDVLPSQKKGGGAFRWLFFGLLLGGIVAFLSSPFSGPVGERINNLRRDLGLGGDEIDDSQYWPSPPQETGSSTTGGSTTGGTAQGDAAGGGDYSPNNLGSSEAGDSNATSNQ